MEEVTNLESDPIQKWKTFTMLAKSRSITYSKLRNKTSRELKQKLTREINKLEEEDITLLSKTNEIYYNYLKRKLNKMQLNEIEGYKKRLFFLEI